MSVRPAGAGGSIHPDGAEFAELVDQARRLTQPVAGLPERLRDHLDGTGQIVEFEEVSGLPECAFVDGAVASEQTDALTWSAAVAVRQTPHRRDAVITAEAVAPISGDGERFRSALMAGCELRAAVDLPDVPAIVDGGLVTSLLSVAYEASLRDPDVAAACDRYLSGIEVVDVAAAFVERLLSGWVVALPKQDTAQGYAEQWQTELSDHDTATLTRMRDRHLAQAVLHPGEMLRPRRALEARRVEAKGDTARSRALDALLQQIRTAEQLHVAYFKPRGGVQRVVKIEYAETDPVEHPRARHLSALLASQCTSPRIMEPFGQHLVDHEAKQQVRTHLAAVSHALTRGLADDALTRHYRT